MRSRFIVLSIAMGAAAAIVCSGHAAPPSQDAMAPEPVSWYPGEIVRNAVVDDAPDDTRAPGVRVSFIGAEHAGKGAALARLGRFRFAYAWESVSDFNACYRQWRDALDSRAQPYNSRNRVTWTPAQTAPDGFATLPEPADPKDAHYLHILSQESGWDSYPFPSAVDPVALNNAQVFNLGGGVHPVTVRLLRWRESSPEQPIAPPRAHKTTLLPGLVTPCRLEMFDFQRLGPSDFLTFLRTAETPLVVTHAHNGWLQARDIPLLLSHADSRLPSARIAKGSAAHIPLDGTTVGETALFLLDSIRSGTFPPALYSGAHDAAQRAEILKWAHEQRP